ncbi:MULTISPECIES: alkene reductase [Streptacidiphilus]|uniref:Alkene reductase n=1 Tax=Streptacidiphilus cavernicola TaxID=3342716 RepID=A0ABV6UNK7_9ACTN|nr:alkene reductase [Streptacidiphilus jeojiense]
MATAFDPIDLGRHRLRSRIVMAPMSRSRAYGPAALPGPSTATYYRQRASAGLIVSEGIQPSPVARGYPATPGLYSPAQVDAWRTVTDAVHAAGGTIFAQLMHAGRIGHPSLLPDGLIPVGPSPITADAQVFTPQGPRPCVEPRELTEADIAATIQDFTTAACNAVAAGFDGVELHGANGFLLHQFLSAQSNTRTDAWGGSVANRIRFPIEVATAVAGAIGADRVGIQLSPGNPYNGMVEQDCPQTYGALATALDGIGLAYLGLAEGPDRALTRKLRGIWSGVFLLNPHTAPRPTGLPELDLVTDGTTDLLSFGSLFLANPDLPHRLALGGPFNPADPSTYYGGDDHGYTDYPTLDQTQTQTQDREQAAGPAPLRARTVP